MGLTWDSDPELGSPNELGGSMCEDKREELDFQNLLGAQTKIINLGLKVADGLKSLKDLKGRGLFIS